MHTSLTFVVSQMQLYIHVHYQVRVQMCLMHLIMTTVKEREIDNSIMIASSIITLLQYYYDHIIHTCSYVVHTHTHTHTHTRILCTHQKERERERKRKDREKDKKERKR